MLSRPLTRKRDGKPHRYRLLVETARAPEGVRQWRLCCPGELSDRGKRGG